MKFETLNKHILELLYKELYRKHKKQKEIHLKGTFSVTLNVEPAPPPPLAVASPEDLGTVGGPLLTPGLVISGGTPPYTVSNVQGTLPAGVTINPDGTFAGLPTAAGAFDVTVDVADSLG